MKSEKAWLVLTTAFCIAFGAYPVAMAYSVTNGGVVWQFNVSDGTATVTGAYPVEGELEIPSSLETNRVTAIGSDAFAGCTALTDIVIPDSVTNIESYAFLDCTGLTDVTIPDSVRYIGPGVFGGCANLRSLVLPFVGSKRGGTRGNGVLFGRIFDGFTSGDGCASVTQHYNASSDGMYWTSATYYIPTNLLSVTITDETWLGENAFEGCAMLTNLILNDGIAGMGSEVFTRCDSLAGMTIPNSVTNIGNYAFEGSGLKTLSVPSSWKGTGMLANAGVPAGCEIIYGYPLRLEPEGGWAVTSPDATVAFTVSCDLPPETDLPLDISAATPGGASAFDVTLPAAGSVAIPAGATSTTFQVRLKTTGLNNAVDIAASGPSGGDWVPAMYNLKGLYGEGSYRWSKSVHHNGTKTDDWDLEPGDTVEFWINNDADEFQACNQYITAGTIGEGLACSALAPWSEAGEGGRYTSGLLTAVDAGEHAQVPFQIKYGDAVIFEYGFHVWGAASGEDVKIPVETISFDDASFGFTVPDGYGISKVEYATEVVDGEWKFDHETTFVVENSEATVDLPNVPGAVFRVTFAK